MTVARNHPEFPLTREGHWLSDGIQASDPHRQQLALADMILTLGADDAYAIAARNEVAAIMGHASATVQCEEVDASRFSLEHADVYQRISRYMQQLDRVAAALASAGIPLVALKNAGIARGLYPCPGCCPMGDVDVLVRRADFQRAHAILVELGFQFEFRSPLEVADAISAEQSGGTEYWIEDEGGTRFWLELQWRPVAGRWIRPDQEPNGDCLVERSLAIAGTHARLLSPVDNLLQVALHTAKHSYVRAPGFRLHTDVDRIVLRQTIDWDSFLSQTLQLRVATPVYFSLLLAKRLLATPIPDEVLARLQVGRWKRNWIARQLIGVNLLEPHAPKFGRTQYLCFNAALYDDLRGLGRALFPPTEWMLQRYGASSRWALPGIYARRATELLFRRART